MDYPSNINIQLYDGKFHDGNPSQGINPSRWPAAHANAITDELIELITHAGLTPDEVDLTQVRQAVDTLITNQINQLIAAAPGTLDTLNELAAALGDDPNFATTMTNALAQKLDISAYTAADVLAKLLTVDGAGSGLDADKVHGVAGNTLWHSGNDGTGSGLHADLLDGNHGSYFHSPSNPETVAGTVAAFAKSSVPSGWLECNGAAISRTTYSDLFAAIGTTYGNGNGSTTFNIPDLRGEFIRGYDNGRGVDSGRGFGSFQTDGYAIHDHETLHAYAGSSSRPTGFTAVNNSLSPNNIGGGTADDFWGSSKSKTSGGNETRPRNIAMKFCIKY